MEIFDRFILNGSFLCASADSSRSIITTENLWFSNHLRIIGFLHFKAVSTYVLKKLCRNISEFVYSREKYLYRLYFDQSRIIDDSKSLNQRGSFPFGCINAEMNVAVCEVPHSRESIEPASQVLDMTKSTPS